MMIVQVSRWFSDNFEQIWIPVLAAVGAIIVRALIHRSAKRWMKRVETELEIKLIRAIESASTPLLFLIALYLICFGLPVRPSIIWVLQRGFAIAAIVVAIGAISRIAGIAGEIWRSRNPTMDSYIHPLRALVSAVAVLAGIGITINLLALDLREEGQRLTRITGIVLGGYFVIRIVQIVIAKLETIVGSRHGATSAEATRRARTLGRVLNNVTWAMVVSIGVTMVLSEFNVNIMPIITGAGIAGIALGLGAQNLVRDVIGGFFLILENQVRVGDVAVINGTGGSVEAINLRTIVLRDLRGAVHVFPNGGISHVSNMSKEWSRCVIDLPVSSKEDTDRVMKVLAEVGDEFCADPAFKPLVIDKLEVPGIEDLGEFLVTIRVTIKTQPLKQWIVARELRRRIKIRFDREGIRTSSPPDSAPKLERGRKASHSGEPLHDSDPMLG
jgi:small conductance mechanosensitive channel